MAKLIDWYSVELNAFLRGRMSEERRFDSVREITSHLSEHVEEMMSKGMPEQEAEKAAISALGDPKKVAASLAARKSSSAFGFGIQLIAALGVAVCLIFTAFLSLQFSQELRLNISNNLRSQIMAVISVTVACCIVYAISGALQRQMRMGLLTCAVLFGFVGSAFFVGMQSDRQNVSGTDREYLRLSLPKWNESLKQSKAMGETLYAIERKLQDRGTNILEAESILANLKTKLGAFPAAMMNVKSPSLGRYPIPSDFGHSGYYRQMWDRAPKLPELPHGIVTFRFTNDIHAAVSNWQADSQGFHYDSFSQFTVGQEMFLSRVDDVIKFNKYEGWKQILPDLAGQSVLALILTFLIGTGISGLTRINLKSNYRRIVA